MTRTDTPNFTIREAGPADAGRISLVANASFLETFAGMIAGDALMAHCERVNAPGYIAERLGAEAKAWLVELDDAPIGYALIDTPDLDAARRGDVELKKIYLLSRFQGSGLAAKMLDAAVAGARGHERLLLGVKDDNRRAIGFYTKQGFEQVGTRRFNVGGHYYSDVVLALDLTQD